MFFLTYNKMPSGLLRCLWAKFACLHCAHTNEEGFVNFSGIGFFVVILGI